MRVTIMGSGGVGGYFGAKLVNSGNHVTFIARGPHLLEMQRNGLTIRSRQEGEYTLKVNAVSNPASAAKKADLILFCVKSYDTVESAKLIKPIVGPQTVVISLQNGMDNENILSKLLGQANLMGGVAYIFANIIKPGVIVHHQLGKIILGNWNAIPSDQTEQISLLLNGAGIPTKVDTDIYHTLWKKFVFLVALSGTTAMTRKPVGIIRSQTETRELWRHQIEELLALAKADGSDLGVERLSEYEKMLDSLAPENYSSLYHDLITNKRLELEALHGHAIKLGKRYSIPVPVLETVHAALIPYLNGKT